MHILGADFKDGLTVNCRTANRWFNRRTPNDSRGIMYVTLRNMRLISRTSLKKQNCC